MCLDCLVEMRKSKMRRAENLNDYQKLKSISCPRAMTHRVYCVWPFHPECLDVGEVLEDEFV